MTRHARLALVLSSLAAGGCGPAPGDEPADANGVSKADASAPRDAGGPADAEPVRDAGPSLDAQATADVGPLPADAGAPADAGCATPADCAAAAERRASSRLDAVALDPYLLATFLAGVPKGGDLHHHLSGAIYAETYLGWGEAEGFCVNSASLSLTSSCGAGNVPIPNSEDPLYTQLVEAWSMENFQPAGITVVEP